MQLILSGTLLRCLTVRLRCLAVLLRSNRALRTDAPCTHRNMTSSQFALQPRRCFNGLRNHDMGQAQGEHHTSACIARERPRRVEYR